MKLYIFFDCDGDGGLLIIPAGDEMTAREMARSEGYENPQELEIYGLNDGPIYYNAYSA